MNAVGSLGATDHVLLENQGRPSNPSKPMDINCFLYSLRGVSLKTKYACVQCQTGYHPTCYLVVHCCHLLKENTKALVDVVMVTAKKSKDGNHCWFEECGYAGCHSIACR